MGFKIKAPKIKAPKIAIDNKSFKNVTQNMIGAGIGRLAGIPGLLGMSKFKEAMNPALIGPPQVPGMADRGEVAEDINDQERMGLMRKRASQTLFTGGQGVGSTPTASAVLLGA